MLTSSIVLVMIVNTVAASAAPFVALLASTLDPGHRVTTTDVAKELARTWAAFINQDPTVAPTLAADVQAAINNCGGTLATVFGGDPGWLRTAIYGASSGIGGFFTELQAPANLPFHMRYTDYGGVQDMRLSASGNIVGMDLDIDAHPTVVFDAGPSLDSTIASATLDFTFPRNGTLTMEINHSWLTEYATDVPQWGASALIKRPTEPVSIGGTVLMAGKPYEPIYDLALKTAGTIAGREIDKSKVLAIGDGPETDIKGAADFGISVVLIADGVTDASDGLEATLARVEAKVPHAKIVKILHHLGWE